MKKIVLFTWIALLTTWAHAQSWNLEKDKHDIKVYNKAISGSKLKEFKGVMTVNASVQDVVAILTDYKQHDKFVYKARTGSVELLDKKGNDLYTYMIINTPWPAANRDIVTLYSVQPTASDGTVKINVTSVHGMKPEQKGIVRVEEMKGYWEVKPIGNNQVTITHQAYSRPGGKVPDGMANAASVSAPFDMLSDLKKMLQ